MSVDRAGQPLSPREKGVIVLVSQGFTSKQIGEKLYLTENTVKTHLRRIFEKLEAHDRAHAVAKALREGIIQ